MTNTDLSKYLSLILRHKPEKAGIVLDSKGWAQVSDLIDSVKGLNMAKLEEIVREDDKQRYSFNNDKTKIRANQGHSVKVDVDLKEGVPPKILYHGTVDKYLDNIFKEGLRKMSRLYVHLSEDIETAKKVGSRRGDAVILKVNTENMLSCGYKFYKSENGVWLTDNVPPQYLIRE